jgi:hypothetical protein
MTSNPRMPGALVAVAFLLGLALPASAGLITSASSLPSPGSVIDFSQFAGANPIRITTVPVQVGELVGKDITLTSTNPDGSVLGSGPYDFNDNGSWSPASTFAGLDVDLFGNDQYTMTFHFNGGPVAAVGGLLNYAVLADSGFSDVVISALDSKGAVLESYDITQLAPISTPGAVDGGAFRGIVRSSADIAGFSLSNSAVAIADLTFSTAVPEPASWCLVMAGLVGAALRRHFKRSGPTRFCC